MIRVNVEIDIKSWHDKIKNPKKYFRKKLKKISKNINFFKEKNITFTILLTNSLNMKRLNKKYRNHNIKFYGIDPAKGMLKIAKKKKKDKRVKFLEGSFEKISLINQ